MAKWMVRHHLVSKTRIYLLICIFAGDYDVISSLHVLRKETSKMEISEESIPPYILCHFTENVLAMLQNRFSITCSVTFSLIDSYRNHLWQVLSHKPFGYMQLSGSPLYKVKLPQSLFTNPSITTQF